MNNLVAEHLAPINTVEKGKSDEFDKKIRSIFGESIDLPPAALEPKFLSEMTMK